MLRRIQEWEKFVQLKHSTGREVNSGLQAKSSNEDTCHVQRHSIRGLSKLVNASFCTFSRCSKGCLCKQVVTTILFKPLEVMMRKFWPERAGETIQDTSWMWYVLEILLALLQTLVKMDNIRDQQNSQSRVPPRRSNKVMSPTLWNVFVVPWKSLKPSNEWQEGATKLNYSIARTRNNHHESYPLFTHNIARWSLNGLNIQDMWTPNPKSPIPLPLLQQNLCIRNKS